MCINWCSFRYEFIKNKEERNITKMLQIKSVRKTFNETVILQEISLLCERGKIYGIMGRNGSGKSVLFKCICGFLEVDSGEIVLDDQVLSNGKMGNKRVGFIIENPAFLPQYSGFQEFSYVIFHQ